MKVEEKAEQTPDAGGKTSGKFCRHAALTKFKQIVLAVEAKEPSCTRVVS